MLSQTVVKSDELQQMAEQYGITLGKAQLIQEILGKTLYHTFDELAPLSINERIFCWGRKGQKPMLRLLERPVKRDISGRQRPKRSHWQRRVYLRAT